VEERLRDYHYNNTVEALGEEKVKRSIDYWHNEVFSMNEEALEERPND
jgi:hypothetical protein